MELERLLRAYRPSSGLEPVDGYFGTLRCCPLDVHTCKIVVKLPAKTVARMSLALALVGKCMGFPTDSSAGLKEITPTIHLVPIPRALPRGSRESLLVWRGSIPIKGSGPALCRIRHNDSYRSPPFIISVIPGLNAGGFCPIALPNDQHTYAQCCRGAQFGLVSNARERRSSIAGGGVHASSDRA